MTQGRRTNTPERKIEVLMSRRMVTPSGCWQWTGNATKGGYGVMYVNGKREYVHRVAYSLWVGPLEPGQHSDHLCRNTLCFRPEHLQSVTARTNVLRGAHPNAVAHRTDTCRKGLHSLTGDNVVTSPGGGRRCRACQLAWLRERRQRARASRE